MSEATYNAPLALGWLSTEQVGHPSCSLISGLAGAGRHLCNMDPVDLLLAILGREDVLRTPSPPLEEVISPQAPPPFPISSPVSPPPPSPPFLLPSSSFTFYSPSPPSSISSPSPPSSISSPVPPPPPSPPLLPTFTISPSSPGHSPVISLTGNHLVPMLNTPLCNHFR